MLKFQFRAVRDDQSEETGEIEAVDLETARLKLSSDGLHVLSLGLSPGSQAPVPPKSSSFRSRWKEHQRFNSAETRPLPAAPQRDLAAGMPGQLPAISPALETPQSKFQARWRENLRYNRSQPPGPPAPPAELTPLDPPVSSPELVTRPMEPPKADKPPLVPQPAPANRPFRARWKDNLQRENPVPSPRSSDPVEQAPPPPDVVLPPPQLEPAISAVIEPSPALPLPGPVAAKRPFKARWKEALAKTQPKDDEVRLQPLNLPTEPVLPLSIPSPPRPAPPPLSLPMDLEPTSLDLTSEGILALEGTPVNSAPGVDLLPVVDRNRPLEVPNTESELLISPPLRPKPRALLQSVGLNAHHLPPAIEPDEKSAFKPAGASSEILPGDAPVGLPTNLSSDIKQHPRLRPSLRSSAMREKVQSTGLPLELPPSADPNENNPMGGAFLEGPGELALGAPEIDAMDELFTGGAQVEPLIELKFSSPPQPPPPEPVKPDPSFAIRVPDPPPAPPIPKDTLQIEEALKSFETSRLSKLNKTMMIPREDLPDLQSSSSLVRKARGTAKVAEKFEDLPPVSSSRVQQKTPRQNEPHMGRTVLKTVVGCVILEILFLLVSHRKLLVQGTYRFQYSKANPIIVSLVLDDDTVIVVPTESMQTTQSGIVTTFNAELSYYKWSAPTDIKVHIEVEANPPYVIDSVPVRVETGRTILPLVTLDTQSRGSGGAPQNHRPTL